MILFRVWETKTWSCEKWGDLNGTCIVSLYTSNKQKVSVL